MRRLVTMLILLSATALLAGCFRDASTNRNDFTSEPISNFINTPTSAPSAEDQAEIPTFTPAPPQSPTPTLGPGGPPADDGDAEDGDGAESAFGLPAVNSAIPSFTPAQGNIFGDSGITIPSIPGTPIIPDALITPTAFGEVAEGSCIYVVQPNDTLTRIVTQLEVEIEDMINANPALIANPNALSIDQELNIPGCTPEGQSTPTNPNPSVTQAPSGIINPTATQARAAGTRVHVVESGQSLFQISQLYGVTVADIVTANVELLNENTIIFPGQELIIPAS